MATRQAMSSHGHRLAVIATPGFADYALLDSGNGRKLERFGRFTVDRPEPQAMWQPALEPGVWLQGRRRLQGRQRRGGRRGRALAQEHADAGDLAAAGARTSPCSCRLTSFRHLGLFPEQLPHWQWMLDRLSGRAASRRACSTCSPTRARPR